MTAFSRSQWLGASAAAAAGCALALPRLAAAQNAALKIGVPPAEPSGPAYYAYELGYFKQAGLDVELQVLENGSAIAAAIISGAVQFGATQVLQLALAHLRNIPFQMFVPGAYWDGDYPNAGLLVAPNSPLRRARDLAGKTVGVTSLSGLDSLSISAYVDGDGGDIHAVKLVEMPGSVQLPAILQGRVDAGLASEPSFSADVATKQIRVLATPYSAIAHKFILNVWFARPDWLAANHATAQKVAEVLAAAGEWAMKNREQAAVYLAKYVPLKEKQITSRFAAKLDPGLIQPVYDAAHKYGMFAGPVDCRELIWSGK